jgi:hypothetical protein
MKGRILFGVIDHTGIRTLRISAAEQHFGHSTARWVFLEQQLYLYHLQKTQDFKLTRIDCCMVLGVGLRSEIAVSIFAGRIIVRRL